MKKPLLSYVDAEGALKRKLERMGPSRAMDTLLSKYGNLGTRLTYVYDLSLYFDWLKEKGITMTPEELVKDNLECVFRSDPTDVITKAKHTSWLDEFVNKHLIEQDCAESRRRHATAAVRAFYKRNNSPLFGDFALASQPAERPVKPLFTEDIRLVLKTLPLEVRTPLIITWQSGLEPLKVYSTKFASDQAPPVKVELFGRKLHRKPYSTFVGSDSVNHLRMLGDVITGKTEGRQNSTEVTIFDSTGLGIQDAAAAGLVYEKAKKAGAGTWAKFG